MSTNQRRRLLLGRMGAALLFAASMASRADAQSLPYDRTTLLHGLASSAAIWTTSYPALASRTPVQYLSQEVQLKVVGAPNLNLGAPTDRGHRYAAQRDNLTQFVTGAGGQHVLVGHSLGSLVARGTFGSAGVGTSRVSGILAIAAPHQGARIAITADSAALFFRDLERAVERAQNGAAIVGAVLTAVGLITQQAWLIVLGGLYLDANEEAINFPLDGPEAIREAEALKDLGPNTPVVQDLNAYRGDGVIPRANITGTIPYGHAILRLAASMPGAASFESLKKRKEEGLSSLRNCRNMGNWTFNLTDPGNRCQRAARMLESLDARWAGWVNGTEYGLVVRVAGMSIYGQVPRKVPFDGVVPNERSVYPTSNGLSYSANVDGANHLDIYRHPDGLNAGGAAMVAMGMSPAAAFTASIDGPTSYDSYATLTWHAVPQGGDGTYSYSWSHRPEGSSQWYTFGNTGSSLSISVDPDLPSFAVRVMVSSQGQTVTAETYATNTNPEPCVPPPGELSCNDY